MMSDDINRLIGQLQEGQRQSEQSRDRMFEYLKEGFDKIDHQLEIIPALKLTVDEIAPMARDWKATKNRAIGALAVTGIGGFMGGAGLASLVKGAFAAVFGK